MARAKKVDANHAAVRNHLRSIGWCLHDSSAYGGGFPDFVCAHTGTRETCLVEVKAGKSGLNERQREFRESWPGAIFVVRSPDDAEKQLTLWLLSRASLVSGKSG